MLGGVHQLVHDDGEQSPVGAGAPLRAVGEREERFAQQRADGEDTGVVHELCAQVERDLEEAYVGPAVEAVGVREARGRPGDAVGRGDPGSAVGGGGQRAGGGIDELPHRVRVGGGESVAVGQPRATLQRLRVRTGVRRRGLAVFRHQAFSQPPRPARDHASCVSPVGNDRSTTGRRRVRSSARSSTTRGPGTPRASAGPRADAAPPWRPAGPRTCAPLPSAGPAACTRTGSGHSCRTVIVLTDNRRTHVSPRPEEIP